MLAAEFNLFDTIAGLPTHPLVVHAAVVLLPLAALLLAVLVFVRRWRPGLATPTLLALAAGTAAAFGAKESGESLANRIGGVPADHERWGSLTPGVAVALLAVGAVWWFLQRRDRRAASVRDGSPKPDSLLTRLVGLVAVVLALVVTGLAVLAGHSGATAVWSGRMTAAQTTPAAAPAVAPSAQSDPSAPSAPSATASTPVGATYTLADVAKHGTPTSCWAAIDGNVYDLTTWIPQHPGGAAIIRGLCGRDVTAEFDGQHGGQPKPETTLATFKVGTLRG